MEVYVDLQVNGYGGVDFSSATLTEDAFIHASDGVLSSGTAAYLPTIVTSPKAVYQNTLRIIAKVMTRPQYAGRILGVHLEGPFINPRPGAVGAHDPASVRDPDVGFLNELIDISNGNIRLITIAADMPGAVNLCRHAVDNNIVVSLGHQLASTGQLASLAASGAAALTHLGNGIPNMLPRHENPIFAGIAENRLSAMIITDGHHLPPEVITTVIRAKGVKKTIVTSDAACIAGCPPGEYYTHGNRALLESSGRIYNPDKQCLVGSSAMMRDCVRHLRSLDIVNDDEIMCMSVDNPMALLDGRKS